MNKLFFTIILLCLTALLTNAQKQGNGTGDGTGNGTGQGQGSGLGSKTSPPKKKPVAAKNKFLRVTSKPRALHTETARNNNVQGTVSLKVEFKKDGKIGKISVVSALPDGLTEQAIKAAEQIRFEPETKNGKPITVTKTVQYTFTLY